jgi:hypothetical protein
MVKTIILDTQPLVKTDLGLLFWTVLSLTFFALGILFIWKIYKYVTRKS